MGNVGGQCRRPNRYLATTIVYNGRQDIEARIQEFGSQNFGLRIADCGFGGNSELRTPNPVNGERRAANAFILPVSVLPRSVG
jgi:hypothetical protein